jgi:hypothetical protein
MSNFSILGGARALLVPLSPPLPASKAHEQGTWPQNRVTTKAKQLRANANSRMARVNVQPPNAPIVGE